MSPDALALICGSQKLTYSQLDRRSEVVAEHLRRLGQWTEKPVGILAPSGWEFVAALMGIWKVGGIAVPLQPHHPLAELEYIISDTGLDVVLVDSSSEACLELIRKLNVATVLSVEDDEVTTLAEVPHWPATQGALIIYTSGTTNRPKGVVSTLGSLDAQISGLMTAWDWQSTDRVMNVLPLHHVHGLVNILLCALASGATCEMKDKFDAVEVWQRITSGAINVFMAVPTVYTKLIEFWEKQISVERTRLSLGAQKMRLMVSGSAALPQPVFESWHKISGHYLLERYGMTEIGMALSNPLRGERKVRTVGRPLPGVDVSLRDASGAVIDDPGTAGELHIRGANLFREYWRKPEATRESFSVDGYFKTGDIAERDEDGYYRILGRSSQDIIKSGGYKISALEIESVLLEHGEVSEVAVVGVSDEMWGERVAAVLVGAATSEELSSWLKDRLAVYKIPTLWRTVDALPRNAMGKVIKSEVRKLFGARS